MSRDATVARTFDEAWTRIRSATKQGLYRYVGSAWIFNEHVYSLYTGLTTHFDIQDSLKRHRS